MRRRETVATSMTAHMFELPFPPQNLGVGFFSPADWTGTIGLLVALVWGRVMVLYTVVTGTPVPTMDMTSVAVVFPFKDEEEISLTGMDIEAEVLRSVALCGIRLLVVETGMGVVSALLDVGIMLVVRVKIVLLQVDDAEGPFF